MDFISTVKGSLLDIHPICVDTIKFYSDNGGQAILFRRACRAAGSGM